MGRMLTTLLLLALTAPLGAGAAERGARADLWNSLGESVGTAIFSERHGGIAMQIEVHGLRPGSHGFHIHTVGTCQPPDFTSAGGHFNPWGKKHGERNPEGMHAGDLPNLQVDAKGVGRLGVAIAGVAMDEGRNGLFHPGGTSLIIHADADDGLTDPAGNAGKRVVCGVIVPVP